MTRARGTRRNPANAPGIRAGIDDFRGKLEPRFNPIDDLSRFAADRIRELETEPVTDMVAQLHDDQPMAHRYAGYVRRDCVAFRRILAEYCTELAEQTAAFPDQGITAFARAMGLRYAVLAIANRWSDHPNFLDEWRLG